MPRSARIVLPNTPHHVVQRGHNKQPVFFDEEDFEAYLCIFRKWTAEFGVKVYGYCLMTNHVHFVLDPGSDVHSLAKAMKRVSGRATRRINRLHNRSGTLWESRYKSSPIQTSEYLLACCRYIDLNPVSAGMVVHPDEYRWSSFRQKTSDSASTWINLDDCYIALGKTENERMQTYAKFVIEGVPANGEIDLIRRALNSGRLTGNGRFIDEVEKATGEQFVLRGPGRPAIGGRK
ncbi:MAG: transposase [Lysobacterales bacterium]|nr:MAG: transposase [Xanthomonadales bacterium]